MSAFTPNRKRRYGEVGGKGRRALLVCSKILSREFIVALRVLEEGRSGKAVRAVRLQRRTLPQHAKARFCRR